jgi:hypothetical protein
VARLRAIDSQRKSASLFRSRAKRGIFTSFGQFIFHKAFISRGHVEERRISWQSNFLALTSERAARALFCLIKQGMF